MQFIVFAAFAIVLGVPATGPPWLPALARSYPWVLSPIWTTSIVVAQIAIPALIGIVYARLVAVKLEREPAWLPAAQHKMAQGAFFSRLSLLVGFCAAVLLTDFVPRVNRWEKIAGIWGLDELTLLAPFLLAILGSWLTLYPADRAIRQVSLEHRLLAAAPARPVWNLWAYLNFMFRQHVLIIAAPMVPIMVANDFSYAYRAEIRRATGLAWADQAVLVMMAGLIFLFAPVMLRHIWQTRVLPAGELRERLDQLCRRVGLTYREILIWETDGMVVNAAVMGMFRPVRYIMLSDGLLEMLDDRKIEAVFGHEAGHVKHRHIEFFLLFAVLSMLIVGGINLYISRWLKEYAPGMLTVHEAEGYMQFFGMALIILIWGVGFGIVSRRFEWQADLFGARCVTPDRDECMQPCILHGMSDGETNGPDTETPGRGDTDILTASPRPRVSASSLADHSGEPVCATAAGVFADALHHIAALNGIPAEARSWRHSSIANRIGLLNRYARDPGASAQLETTVAVIKAILIAGTMIGLAVGVWLFMP